MQDIAESLRERKDEVGDLVRALAHLVVTSRASLLGVNNGAGTLSASSDGLIAISQRLTAGVRETSSKAQAVAAAAEESSAKNTVSVAASMEQASTNLASVATATEEMSATVTDIASNSERARAISDQATAQARSPYPS